MGPLTVKRPTLWFVIPCFQRFELAAISLAHLASVCAELRERGIQADACVIADDANLAVAEGLGFATINRSNEYLGRKLNDGYAYAHDSGADYVIPFGSDDFLTADVIARSLPEADDTISVFRHAGIVNETGTKMVKISITYPGGIGVRIWPLKFFEPLGYRPVPEMAQRAMDGATHESVLRSLGRRKLPFVYHESDPLEIVEFKGTDNLNAYSEVRQAFAETETDDPWGELAEFYPTKMLSDLQALYAREPIAA